MRRRSAAPKVARHHNDHSGVIGIDECVGRPRVRPRLSPMQRSNMEKRASWRRMTSRTPGLSRMSHRRWTIRRIAVGIFMLLSPWLWDCCAHASGIRSLFIAEPLWQVPAEAAGSQSHVFRIYNLRPAWTSLRAQACCGCLGTSWSTRRIPPFMWADLTTSFAFVATPPGAVPAERTITIQTDDRRQPRLYAFIEH